MADKKISALTAETSPEAADLAHIVTDLGTTATNKKVTLETFFNKIPTTIGYNTEASKLSIAIGTNVKSGNRSVYGLNNAQQRYVRTKAVGIGYDINNYIKVKF